MYMNFVFFVCPLRPKLEINKLLTYIDVYELELPELSIVTSFVRHQMSLYHTKMLIKIYEPIKLYIKREIV